MTTNAELLSRRTQAVARGVSSMHPIAAARAIRGMHNLEYKGSHYFFMPAKRSPAMRRVSSFLGKAKRTLSTPYPSSV